MEPLEVADPDDGLGELGGVGIDLDAMQLFGANIGGGVEVDVEAFSEADDFVIEVRPNGTGSIVQMRSKSRQGKGDVGANAARIKALFAKLR